MTVLILSAHPDDEVLGMGSTIIKMVTAGHTVYCWFYFSGTNCNGVQQAQPEEVARVLGTVYPPFVMSMTVPNEGDTIPMLDIARSIEDTIKLTEPEVVYTHSTYDLNIDHQRVAEASIIATRPRPGNDIKQLLSYEVPTVTDWSFGKLGGTFTPNVYEGLSSLQFSCKMNALSIYGDLTNNYTYPVIALCKYRGSQVGCEYAEAFELIWNRR